MEYRLAQKMILVYSNLKGSRQSVDDIFCAPNVLLLMTVSMASTKYEFLIVFADRRLCVWSLGYPLSAYRVHVFIPSGWLVSYFLPSISLAELDDDLVYETIALTNGIE